MPGLKDFVSLFDDEFDDNDKSKLELLSDGESFDTIDDMLDFLSDVFYESASLSWRMKYTMIRALSDSQMRKEIKDFHENTQNGALTPMRSIYRGREIVKKASDEFSF